MRTLASLVAVAIYLMAVFPSTLVAAQTHLGVKADEIVLLQWECNVGTPTRLLPDGSRVTNFAIPRTRTLVITDLEWRASVPSDSPGLNYIVEAQLQDKDGFVSAAYLGLLPLLQGRGYLSDHLTAGIVLDASVTLDNDAFGPRPRFSLFGVAPGAAEPVNCKATLRGYLVN